MTPHACTLPWSRRKGGQRCTGQCIIRATPLPNHLICSADQCKGSLPKTLPSPTYIVMRWEYSPLRFVFFVLLFEIWCWWWWTNERWWHETHLCCAVPEQTDDSTEGGKRQQTEDIRAGFYHRSHLYLYYLGAYLYKSKLSSYGCKHLSHVAVFTFHLLTDEDLNHI